MICKSCFGIGKISPLKQEKWGRNLFLFSCTNPLCVRSIWAEWTSKGWKKATLRSPYAKAHRKTDSHWSGSGIHYWDGGKERVISEAMLREIKSSVMTHDGQELKGEAARKYMDKHSKTMLGKDLAGSYKDTSIQGYVK